MNKFSILILTLALQTFISQDKLSAQGVSPQLDSLLNARLDSMQSLMGCKSLSAAIQCPDGGLWSGASGISSMLPYAEVTTNDVFLIGSIVKTMTSACILQMVDESSIGLDDGIYEYLDTIEYVDPNITIRQLLRHQSGIYDVLSNPACQPALISNMGYVWPTIDLITTFLQAPLFEPGTNWSYSNTNYFLLGMIIESVSGQPYYAELRERFFDPLGLNSVAIPAYETLTNPVAHVWLDINGDGTTDDANSFYMNYLSLNGAAGAAGGYFGTPTDITKWMNTYMKGDLVSFETMEEARETVNAPGLPGTTYGLGLMKKTFNQLVGYGHGGDLSYSASSWYFPETGFSVTVCNNDSEYNSWSLVPVVESLMEALEIITCEAFVSVNEFSEFPLVNIFPNPFLDKITLDFSEVHQRPFQYILSDVTGKFLLGDEIPDGVESITLNEIQLPNEGVYLLKLNHEDGTSECFKILHYIN